MSKSDSFDIPSLTQDSLADKIGKAVAEAMTPTVQGVLKAPDIRAPVIPEERTSSARLDPRERDRRDRRRYY